MLEVCEIFTSIQGEGPLMGRPAVFLRLSGCIPPYCVNCDTPQGLVSGTLMENSDILPRLLSGPVLVVITGGEPFLQWDQGLSALCADLAAAGKEIQFETSGKTQIPENAGGTVVCSPKPMDAPELSPDILLKTDAFKFVVGDDPEPVMTAIRKWNLPADRVWLMPEGKTREEQLGRMPAVWRMAVDNGFRFSARLHILTFNDEAGV